MTASAPDRLAASNEYPAAPDGQPANDSAALSASLFKAGSNVTGASPANARSPFTAPSVAATDAADSVPAAHVAAEPVQPAGTSAAERTVSHCSYADARSLAAADGATASSATNTSTTSFKA